MLTFYLAEPEPCVDPVQDVFDTVLEAGWESQTTPDMRNLTR